VVHIHAEGPAFFCWIPKLFGKRVICTIHGLDWDREKWRGSVASKFIRGGEKNAVKYADEIIVLSKDVQKYFLETYGTVINVNTLELKDLVILHLGIHGEVTLKKASRIKVFLWCFAKMKREKNL